MRRLATVAAVVTTACTLGSIGFGVATIASAQPVADQAPECVTVVVLAPQANGSTARVHLEFCGNGPGADSALHDWAAGRRFVLDGARRVGGDCGGRADPCVIFPR